MALTPNAAMGGPGLSGFEETIIDAGVRPNSYFGRVVAAGESVVIADSIYITPGVAHVFRRTEAGWEEETLLRAPPGQQFGLFAFALDARGDTLALLGQDLDNPRANKVHVYREEDGMWAIEGDARASGGESFSQVAVAGDLLIASALQSAFGVSDPAVAYVYRRQDGVWVEEAKLYPSSPFSPATFGRSVAISRNTAAVGATESDIATLNASPGAVVVFRHSEEGWHQEAHLELPFRRRREADRFGGAIAIDGETLVIGADGRDDDGSNAGRAYAYERRGSSWTGPVTVTAEDVEDGDRFGSAVDIEGGTILVGAANDEGRGSAYVFRRRGAAWTEQAKLTPSNGQAGDRFGVTAASLRGEMVVAGAPSVNVNTGSVYVYESPERIVILGPGIQRGRVGSDGELVLSVDSRDLPISSLSFAASIEPGVWEPSFRSGGGGEVDCVLAPDLADSFELSVTTPDRGHLLVELFPEGDGEHNLLRDGLIGYCRGRVSDGVPAGRVPLGCISSEEQPQVLDADGNIQPSTCEDGELEVLPCFGDCNADGSVAIDELALGVRLLIGRVRDRCAILDENEDDMVDVVEIMHAIGSALKSPC